jgi:hypothetical protein
MSNWVQVTTAPNFKYKGNRYAGHIDKLLKVIKRTEMYYGIVDRGVQEYVQISQPNFSCWQNAGDMLLDHVRSSMQICEIFQLEYGQKRLEFHEQISFSTNSWHTLMLLNLGMVATRSIFWQCCRKRLAQVAKTCGRLLHQHIRASRL